jgi:hypothetical protein
MANAAVAVLDESRGAKLTDAAFAARPPFATALRLSERGRGPQVTIMLNRCPSCQASVLDDDAEVCPFCGSPMDPVKAKGFKPAPSAAAAAPPVPKAPAPAKTAAPAPKADSTAKPAPKKTPSPKAPAAKTSDDPFAIDPAATAGAIALSPKRTQQRPNKVVCPMCDTVGFAPDAASGKEVRCANRECLVPVFTAPDFAAPPPVAPEPQSSNLGATLLTFGAVFLILIAGLSVWWFVLRKEPSKAASSTPIAVAPTPETPVESEATPSPKPNAQPNTPAPPTPSETLASVKKRWPGLAEDISQPERQPLRRRYAAEAYAIAGRPELARAQLQKLGALRSADPFYKIAPLTYLAWLELASGDEAAAKASFAESAKLTGEIPRQGFDPARTVIEWSAAAARLGSEGAARDLARNPRDPDGEQLLAMLQAASVFARDDLSAEYPLRPIMPWSQPKATAATFALLDRKALDQALAWAKGSPDANARAENLAAWAEASTLGSNADPPAISTAITNAISSLSPAERAYIAARAAVRAVSRDQKPTAEALLNHASQAAGEIQTPEATTTSDLAAFARYELPDQEPLRLAAVALGETAHAAALLGKADDAKALLTRALDELKAAAPPESDIAARAGEFKTLTISGVRSQLKGVLELSSDSQAETAANAYRRKLDDVENAAAARTDLQIELLARSVAWNLGDFALTEAKRRSQAAEGQSSENLLAGSAGGRLIAAFEQADDRKTADAVRATGATNRDVPLRPAIELTLEPLLAAGKTAEIAQEIFASRWNRIPSGEKLAIAVRAACRLNREKSTAAAFEFARVIADGNARIEVLRYLAACAATSGHAAEMEALLPKSRLTSTEQAALLRGLTEGLVEAGARGPENSPKTASAGPD